jgi:hypothetical protein
MIVVLLPITAVLLPITAPPDFAVDVVLAVAVRLEAVLLLGVVLLPAALLLPAAVLLAAALLLPATVLLAAALLLPAAVLLAAVVPLFELPPHATARSATAAIAPSAVSRPKLERIRRASFSLDQIFALI